MQKLTFAMAALLLSVAAEASEVISLDVLPCGKPGVAGGLAAGPDLARIKVDTRLHPNAICNDGSPAVFYVRPYVGEENRNKWLVMLQGGGSCGSGQACAERWCSIDSNFGMDKMTTTLTKPSVNGGGMLSPEARNQFGRWNTVLVFYCSSDGWAGRRSDIELSAAFGSANISFRAHFRGADIVDAVFDILRHPSRTRGVRLGNAPIRLPDLDEASDVLFAGASAGGSGVSTNADRIGKLLRANNEACQGSTCPLVYRVVIDSHFAPDRELLDYTKSTYCVSSPTLCTYEGFIRNLQYVVTQARDEVLDASCVDFHSRIEPGTEWMCADTGHVIRNHINEPMFIGQDLQDNLVGGNFIEGGFGNATDFGEAVESQLRALATLDAAAEEGSALTGTALARPGAWGPQCLGHELLGNSSNFYQTKVSAGGISLSYHDTIWNWWSGASPSEAIRDFMTPGAVPGCP